MDKTEPSADQQKRSLRGHAFLMGWPVDSPGGVTCVVRNLLGEALRAGRFSPVAVEVFGQAEGEKQGSSHAWPLVRLGTISTWNSERPWRSVAAFCLKAPFIAWRLWSFCRRYSITVLNPHFAGIDDLPLWFVRKTGIFKGKLILSFHGLDVNTLTSSRGLERFLGKMLLRGADFLVACSSGLRDEIIRFVPECEARTLSIPNGINAAAFLALSTGTFELPERFNGRTILLSVGNYESKKGHDLLLKAFAKLTGVRTDVGLVIAGHGDSGPMARLAAELGVAADVLLLEAVPPAQVAALMNRADIFVLASRWEPFGLVLLEAAAAELPVVSSATAGAAELLADGETGRVVPIGDADAMAGAIHTLIANPEAARRMAHRFHENVLANFTWDKAYQAYADIASK